MLTENKYVVVYSINDEFFEHAIISTDGAAPSKQNVERKLSASLTRKRVHSFRVDNFRVESITPFELFLKGSFLDLGHETRLKKDIHPTVAAAAKFGANLECSFHNEVKKIIDSESLIIDKNDKKAVFALAVELLTS
ncbi:hypothetical protein LMH73_009385 [Vibrio splendidus]|nr:hypothetical protein [Vibrio splendidus]MCC4881870.1 hypothetical protein [Vibrio splendidus]